MKRAKGMFKIMFGPGEHDVATVLFVNFMKYGSQGFNSLATGATYKWTRSTQHFLAPLDWTMGIRITPIPPTNRFPPIPQSENGQKTSPNSFHHHLFLSRRHWIWKKGKLGAPDFLCIIQVPIQNIKSLTGIRSESRLPSDIFDSETQDPCCPPPRSST